MYVFIVVLIVLIAILLVLVVLAQKSKGGVSAQFGGSGATQLIGAKKSGDLLERITWGLAIAMLVLSASTKIFVSNQNAEDPLKSVNEERAGENAAPLQIPGGDDNTPPPPANNDDNPSEE